MANTAFLKEFDDLMAGILVDYANLDSAPDTSQGSITYIKAACLASALWGLYRYQDYIARQAFPDTADSTNLAHWGSIYGLTKQADETDTEFLNRVLARIRRPPAGGNIYDWAYWTKFDANDNAIFATGPSLTTGLQVEEATVVPNAQGPGTVDVVIMPDDISMLSTTGMEDLRTLAYNSVDAQRPVTASSFRVLTVSRRSGAVNITVTASSTSVILDTDQMVDDIQAFFDSLKPGDPVYRAQLSAICINNGAVSATVTAPSVDLIVDSYTLLYPSSITVTQV